MAYLDLKIREGCQEPYIEFHVDGVDLGKRIEEALGEAGFDDVLPWWGGDYSVSDTVLGEEARSEGKQGAILLACGCGYGTCSGVWADVHVNDTEITFRNFSTSRQGREIAADIGPVSFDRGQFEEAVLRLQSRIQEWHPPSETAKPAESEGRVIPLPGPDRPPPDLGGSNNG